MGMSFALIAKQGLVPWIGAGGWDFLSLFVRVVLGQSARPRGAISCQVLQK